MVNSSEGSHLELYDSKITELNVDDEYIVAIEEGADLVVQAQAASLAGLLGAPLVLADATDSADFLSRIDDLELDDVIFVADEGSFSTAFIDDIGLEITNVLTIFSDSTYERSELIYAFLNLGAIPLVLTADNSVSSVVYATNFAIVNQLPLFLVDGTETSTQIEDFEELLEDNGAFFIDVDFEYDVEFDPLTDDLIWAHINTSDWLTAWSDFTENQISKNKNIKTLYSASVDDPLSFFLAGLLAHTGGGIAVPAGGLSDLADESPVLGILELLASETELFEFVGVNIATAALEDFEDAVSVLRESHPTFRIISFVDNVTNNLLTVTSVPSATTYRVFDIFGSQLVSVASPVNIPVPLGQNQITVEAWNGATMLNRFVVRTNSIDKEPDLVDTMLISADSNSHHIVFPTTKKIPRLIQRSYFDFLTMIETDLEAAALTCENVFTLPADPEAEWTYIVKHLSHDSNIACDNLATTPMAGTDDLYASATAIPYLAYMFTLAQDGLSYEVGEEQSRSEKLPEEASRIFLTRFEKLLVDADAAEQNADKNNRSSAYPVYHTRYRTYIELDWVELPFPFSLIGNKMYARGDLDRIIDGDQSYRYKIDGVLESDGTSDYDIKFGETVFAYCPALGSCTYEGNHWGDPNSISITKTSGTNWMQARYEIEAIIPGLQLFDMVPGITVDMTLEVGKGGPGWSLVGKHDNMPTHEVLTGDPFSDYYRMYYSKGINPSCLFSDIDFFGCPMVKVNAGNR